MMAHAWLETLDWAGLEAGRCVADLQFAAHASYLDEMCGLADATAAEDANLFDGF